jgi:hypothetical protein
MLDLLYDSSAQKQAFAEACAWAEDIYLCLAWIEPGDAHGPSFADLKPHEAKLRQAIVGLARFQSYPALLRRLYRSSVLRLVSTVDGSFAPNCYLFRRGSRVRVLHGSAPFTSTRFARPYESLVVFEGERDDPFALRALQLLDQCRASAHVPTATELDAYEDAWANVRTGASVPDALPGLALETCDGAMLGELALQVAPAVVLEALVEVRRSLSTAAAVRIPGSVSFRSGQGQETSVQTTLFWSSLGIWSAIHRDTSHYGLHFGFVPPWEVERPTALVSLSGSTRPVGLDDLTASSAARTMAVARSDDGRRFLLHIPLDPGSDAADVTVCDASGSARAVLVGEIGAADFVQTAAAFARRASRRRAPADAELGDA